MRTTLKASIVLAALLGHGCASTYVDRTGQERFAAASERAFEDGLRACESEATRILVLPTVGDSLLDGDWFDRRGVEKRQDARRVEHTRELEEELRSRGWKVVPCDDAVIGRLRRQYRRLSDDDGFVSLATHVASSLGAEIVVVPRLDFFYESEHSATEDRWSSTLNWVADYSFVDARMDVEIAARWVDTRDVASLERWELADVAAERPAVGLLEASAPAVEGDVVSLPQDTPRTARDDTPVTDGDIQRGDT